MDGGVRADIEKLAAVYSIARPKAFAISDGALVLPTSKVVQEQYNNMKATSALHVFFNMAILPHPRSLIYSLLASLSTSPSTCSNSSEYRLSSSSAAKFRPSTVKGRCWPDLHLGTKGNHSSSVRPNTTREVSNNGLMTRPFRH